MAFNFFWDIKDFLVGQAHSLQKLHKNHKVWQHLQLDMELFWFHILKPQTADTPAKLRFGAVLYHYLLSTDLVAQHSPCNHHYQHKIVFMRLLIKSLTWTIISSEVTNMHCENYFCIYWTKDLCNLNEISLYILGCCQSCIYVDIDEATLNEARKKLLEKLKY